MTNIIKFLGFVVTLGLACCIPVKQNCKNIASINLEATELKTRNEDVSDTDPQDSTSGLEEKSVHYETISQNQPPSTPLHSPCQSSYAEQLQNRKADWSRSSYQANSLGLEERGVAMGRYRDVLYPYAHPMLPAMNSGFSINSLPPVLFTQIHTRMPLQTMAQEVTYNTDELSPENTVMMPIHMRAGRTLRSREDDFLAELEHDAIMNNIIPTMSVPFLRYDGTGQASVPYSHGSYGGVPGGSAIAVFPNVASGGCAQPILLTCSPQIIRGTVVNTKPVKNSSPPQIYGQQKDQKTKNTNKKVNTPAKESSSNIQKPLKTHLKEQN